MFPVSLREKNSIHYPQHFDHAVCAYTCWRCMVDDGLAGTVSPFKLFRPYTAMSKSDGIVRQQSSSGICDAGISDLKEEPEKIFTSALLTPILLTIGYIYFLKKQYDWFLERIEMERPFELVWWSGPIFFCLAYLLVVHYGKKYMADKPEFKIKPFIFTYNLYQCVFNLITFVAMYYEIYSNPIFTGIWGNTHHYGAPSFNIGFLVWLHYNNKYLELLDTMWMVMRKKNKQISFLHCYHHVLLIWSWFIVMIIDPMGDCYFGASINSLIHVIMYGYYTMALLNIPCPWKKWITTMQMAQFCLVATHSIYAFYARKAPFVLAAFQLFVMINMLVLFYDFFYKTYKKKKPEQKKE